LTGGIIAAIVIAVIVFFLSIPLDLQIHLEVYERFKFEFNLRWFFGLVKKELGRREKRAEKEAERGWAFFDFLRIRGLPSRLFRLLKDIFKSIKIRELEVDFGISLGDPAETALFVSAIWLPTFLLGFNLPYLVRVQPLFHDELTFQGHAYVAIRLWPIQLVPALLRFACSRASMRMLGVFLFSRWKRRK
jgi:hypothetical protein